jgi:hypothetical protein
MLILTIISEKDDIFMIINRPSLIYFNWNWPGNKFLTDSQEQLIVMYEKQQT